MILKIYKRKIPNSCYYDYVGIKNDNVIFKLKEDLAELNIIKIENLCNLNISINIELKENYNKYSIKVTEKELQMIYSNDITIRKMIINIFINRIKI